MIRKRRQVNIALTAPGQRARNRAHPTRITALRINLVQADDGNGAFVAAKIDHCHRRAKKYLVNVAIGGVNHLRRVEPFDQLTGAPINLAQPPFAVKGTPINPFFRRIALLRRARNPHVPGRAFRLLRALRLALHPENPNL